MAGSAPDRRPFAARQRALAAPLAKASVINAVLTMAILVLGGALRVWQIDRFGYNTDEAVYAGQAAAIAQAPVLKDIFPVFRAHPLLFQFILALAFANGVSDVNGRLISVGIGLATVWLTIRLGKRLYGQPAGLVAGLFMALMPYHVVVTRQVLLDGPLVFCTTLTLYLLARFASSQRPAWLTAAGLGMGLVFLAKETGIILLGSIYAFLALSRELRVRIRDLIAFGVMMALMISPFPLALTLAGGAKRGQQYLVWQLFRRPNHTWEFYPETVIPAIGPLVIAAALLGLWLLRRQGSWRERLLLAWILVPVTFFQIWPTKGFQYLLPIAPAVALLAARVFTLWPADGAARSRRALFAGRILAVLVVAASLAWASWQRVQPLPGMTFLAGSGGVPGGREAGNWVRENVPARATLMTVGPSMANVLQFYGHRKAYGLSVSPNPLRRNPSYEPILNPDQKIRSGDLQYLVWDSYSAARSTFFSDGLLRYVERYHGRVVHTQTVPVLGPDGQMSEQPVIIIYEVRP